MMLNILNDWVEIPRGQVVLETGGYLAVSTPFDVEPFVISKYPITNQQYNGFIEDGGYNNRSWWTDMGWSARHRQNWQEPCYWKNSAWNRPDYPVVGVSWVEAVAFCRWLGEVSRRTVMLPTEQQWQRAAQGDDGRDYAWGNDEPLEYLCNWNRFRDKTTPVTRYPEGASPYGVMDMCGNVWEWCLTGWDSGTTTLESDEARILRGGSWSSDSPLSLRAAHRNPKDPNIRLNPDYRTHVTIGFRCVF